MPNQRDTETTYPLRAAAQLTGLSPELLRAWERRYGVVEPLRTAGGTRRYRASDLERLRLVKAAVDAGHRIGRVARLDSAELGRHAAPSGSPSRRGLDAVISVLERLDAEETQRLLSLQLAAVGPVRFAREFAIPLVHEIGERWADKRMSVASEHLATALLRSMLGSALLPTAASRLGPRIVFATPSGERHELGLQSAALTAMGAGANPIYLGAELPVEELLRATEQARASVLALSIVTLPADQAGRAIAAVRGGLPPEVRVWIGGARASDVAPLDGVERIACLEELERQVTLLGFEKPNPR
jgi:DNA-binding transcriptional MerR regulator